MRLEYDSDPTQRRLSSSLNGKYSVRRSADPGTSGRIRKTMENQRNKKATVWHMRSSSLSQQERTPMSFATSSGIPGPSCLTDCDHRSQKPFAVPRMAFLSETKNNIEVINRGGELFT